MHEEAERILAERNRARGQAPGDYSVDEYVEAVEAARPSTALREAMKRLGDPYPEDEVVTEFDLSARKDAILRERHGFPFDDDNRPSDEDVVDAYLQAIKELGKPGRKDPAQLQASRRDEVIDRAVNEGRIFALTAGAWRDLWDKNPTLAAKTLAAAKPDPRFKVYGNIAPDPEGFEFCAAVDAGIGKDYDVEQYSRAGELTQNASEAEPETGAIVLASEIVKRTGQPNPGSFFLHAEWAVSAIAAQPRRSERGGRRRHEDRSVVPARRSCRRVLHPHPPPDARRSSICERPRPRRHSHALSHTSVGATPGPPPTA